MLYGKKALIAGISDYNNLEPLKFCNNDGKEMYDVLSSLDYEIRKDHVLLGSVTWEKLRNSLYDFFTEDSVKPIDMLLFYYSGHGVPDYEGDVFLATSEIDPLRPSRRGFNFNELAKLIRESISTSIVVILDCCYSGSAWISKGQAYDPAKIGLSIMDRESNNLTKAGEGKCILAASQAQGEAYGLERSNHSIFTYYLLEALKGRAHEAIDKNGCITVDSIAKYLYNTIMSLPAERRPKQKPIRKIEASGNIILANFCRPIEKSVSIKSTVSNKAMDKGAEYINNKDYLKALEYYERTLKNPDDSKIWLNKAIALHNLWRLDEALQCCNTSLELDPHNIDALELKAIVLFNMDNYDAASKFAEMVIQLDSGEKPLRLANSWFIRGANAYKNKKYEEALKYYDKAIEIYPNAELAYSFKGDLYLAQGKYEQAVDSYEKALQIDPTNALAWSGKARVLHTYGKAEDSIVCYDKAIHFAQNGQITLKNVEDLWNGKGLVLDQIGKLPEALICYDNAIEINSRNPIFWLNKGYIHFRLKNYELAFDCFDKAIEIDPGQWGNKGILFHQLQRFKEAIDCYDKLLKINPNDEGIVRCRENAIKGLNSKS